MNRRRRYVGVGTFFCAVLVFGCLLSRPVVAETLDELKEELSTKKESLKEAEERIKKFKDEIQIKKREARSLQEQIGIIEDNITQLRLSIEETNAEIDATNAEIKIVEKKIEIKEGEIEQQKELLGEHMRLLYQLEQQSSVTIFLKYKTLSEAMSEASTVEELQRRAHEALLLIKELKQELDRQKVSLQEFRDALVSLQKRQEMQRATLTASKESKRLVLRLTKEQEAKYQDLLKEAKEAHIAAQNEIKQLDSQIREELKRQGVGRLPSVGQMDWPIDPIFGISCGFHCPDYPYAYLIGPHTGIDIPTYVGTPVKAPADGYVARVKKANGPGYSYILLIHGDNVSTVYGHLSGFNVSEGDMVSRGSIIGYTGGAPGTNGSGLSTGPHLHFEVRVANTPVDPMGFL